MGLLKQFLGIGKRKELEENLEGAQETVASLQTQIENYKTKNQKQLNQMESLVNQKNRLEEAFYEYSKTISEDDKLLLNIDLLQGEKKQNQVEILKQKIEQDKLLYNELKPSIIKKILSQEAITEDKDKIQRIEIIKKELNAKPFLKKKLESDIQKIEKYQILAEAFIEDNRNQFNKELKNTASFRQNNINNLAESISSVMKQYEQYKSEVLAKWDNNNKNVHSIDDIKKLYRQRKEFLSDLMIINNALLSQDKYQELQENMYHKRDILLKIIKELKVYKFKPIEGIDLEQANKLIINYCEELINFRDATKGFINEIIYEAKKTGKDIDERTNSEAVYIKELKKYLKGVEFTKYPRFELRIAKNKTTHSSRIEINEESDVFEKTIQMHKSIVSANKLKEEISVAFKVIADNANKNNQNLKTKLLDLSASWAYKWPDTKIRHNEKKNQSLYDWSVDATRSDNILWYGDSAGKYWSPELLNTFDFVLLSGLIEQLLESKNNTKIDWDSEKNCQIYATVYMNHVKQILQKETSDSDKSTQ